MLTLCAAGVQSWQRFVPLWFNWWLGDALGALVVAPAILTIAAGPRLQRQDGLRVILFVTASVIITHVTFGRLLGLGVHPLQYVVFPLVIAAALMGGPAVSAMVVLASAVVTIWNTVSGAGPFAAVGVHHNLILLQTFTGVLAGTAMLLSAAIAERKASERRETGSADALRQRDEMLRLAQRVGGTTQACLSGSSIPNTWPRWRSRQAARSVGNERGNCSKPAVSTGSVSEPCWPRTGLP